MSILMYRAAWTALTVLIGAPAGPASGQDLFVYRLSLRSPIDAEVGRVVDRAVAAAERRGAALILDIAVTGGSLDVADRAAQRLDKSSVPIHALVCDRALGVSAMLALAADSVFLCPDATLGGGDDIAGEERGPFGEGLARLMAARALSPDLGRAMVDAGVRIDGVTSTGAPLIMNAELAARVGVTAASVTGFDSLLSILGLDAAQVIDADHAWNNTRAEVSNYNWRDVRVFLLRSGSRVRLGTVTSMNSVDFDVPEGHLATGSQVQLLAEVIGSSERFLTQRVRVEPGLVLQLDIANVIRQSSFSYYRRN